MGFRLRGVILCGGCGKPRGLRHVCVRSFGRKTRAHKLHSPVEWECSTCHKRRGLRHTCSTGTDFKARKRKAATAERRAKRKRARQRQAERRRRAAAERRVRDRAPRPSSRKARPRPGNSHEAGACGDRECPKYTCRAYFKGMDDCPGPHEGG